MLRPSGQDCGAIILVQNLGLNSAPTHSRMILLPSGPPFLVGAELLRFMSVFKFKRKGKNRKHRSLADALCTSNRPAECNNVKELLRGGVSWQCKVSFSICLEMLCKRMEGPLDKVIFEDGNTPFHSTGRFQPGHIHLTTRFPMHCHRCLSIASGVGLQAEPDA